MGEQSMTQHDRTAHTRAEHDRTQQPFSPPDRLGLLEFLEQTPRPHPHPAYRGRQTQSCPDGPRVSLGVPPHPPCIPRPPDPKLSRWSPSVPGNPASSTLHTAAARPQVVPMVPECPWESRLIHPAHRGRQTPSCPDG